MGVLIALGKYHSRKDGLCDGGVRDDGGDLEDTGPLLQVGGSCCFVQKVDLLWSGLANWELGSELIKLQDLICKVLFIPSVTSVTE